MEHSEIWEEFIVELSPIFLHKRFHLSLNMLGSGRMAPMYRLSLFQRMHDLLMGESIFYGTFRPPNHPVACNFEWRDRGGCFGSWTGSVIEYAISTIARAVSQQCTLQIWVCFV